MSLLMEALRKAEEAKSKASKEDTKPEVDHQDDIPETDPFAEFADPGDDSPSVPETDGPVVINPDPDEEEILSAHASDKTRQDMGEPDEQPEVEYEQFEFTTTGASDDPDINTDAAPKPADAETERAADAYFSEDDGLSLLQSSYFSRTQNTGNSSLEDEFPDTEPDTPDAGAGEMSATPATESPVPVAADIAAEVAAETGQQPAAPAREDTQAAEKSKRDSAGALFLAKEDSRKRRLKKLVSIAAIVMLFPLAGIVYWLFTALNDSSGMQFNVQTNANLANRSFSDFQAAVEPEPADNQLAAPATELAAQDTPDSETGNTVELVGQQATAPTGTAQADTGTSPATAQPEQPLEQVAVNTPPPAQPAAVQAPAPRTPTPAAENTPAQTTTTQTSQPTSPAETGGLSFARTAPSQVINPDLSAAFDSYQAGDYGVAARLYQQVLSNEPNNRDAMLHLASVYLKQGNAALAQSLYVKLLALNPRDPLARAGLLETVQGDPVRQEAELKALISAYPGTAQLSFALGNLYATQRRWREAQSAYFDALLAAKSNNTGPVSPDYAFNLAVSLERINQLGAALDYYREARTLTGSAPPGFDPAVLEQRLDALEARLR